MPSSEQKPPITDLSALIRGLSDAGVEFILVGGLAAVAHGAPITTFDLDIVHRQTDGNIEKLLQFLKSIHARQRRPDDRILKPDEKDLRGKGHLLLTTRYGALDILSVIEKDNRFEDLLPHTIKIDFHGREVRVLRLDTIVELKRESKDPKDRYRLPILEETLRQRMSEAPEDPE